MSIHPRALNELKSCKRPDVTPFILSTAIYYIAGYSRYRKQEISQEDLDRLYRIDCKWEVTPSGKESVRNFSDEYSVTVKNEKGKPQKLDLDLHLKAGIKNNDLIRIYFCWDKEKKEILIGSWPEHLR